jgi:hypothetical protein
MPRFNASMLALTRALMSALTGALMRASMHASLLSYMLSSSTEARLVLSRFDTWLQGLL